MMPKIFVSYRRQDSAAYAGRLCDILVREFGRSSVFIDIDGIRPGDEFASVLSATIRQADVLLALIGPRWLDARDETGERRLERLDDLVRLEVSSALSLSIPVIPVLVGGAGIPAATQLPEELRRLPALHACEVSDLHFQRDAQQVVAAIDGRIRVPARVLLALFRYRRAISTVSVLAVLLLAGMRAGEWLRGSRPVAARAATESSATPDNSFAMPALPIAADGENAGAASGPFGPSGSVIDVSTMKLKRELDKLSQVQDLLARAKAANASIGTLGVLLEQVPHGLGVYVAALIDGGPAGRAGLRSGDSIEAIDGRRVEDTYDVQLPIMSAVPGSTMMISIRRGERMLAFPVKVGRMGENDLKEMRAQIEDRAIDMNAEQRRRGQR